MLPGIGGLGGAGGLLPIYAIMFVINLIIQLFSGGLGDIFGMPAAM